MWLDELVKKVCNHLAARGMDYRLSCADPLAGEEAEEAQRTLDIAWPEELWEIVTGYANGFAFRWPASEEDAEPFGEIEFPGWREIHQDRVYWLDFLDHLEEGSFQKVGDPEVAKILAGKSRSWVPVLADANGDQVMVDARTGQVRLHLHDWLDAGSGDTGFFMSKSLRRFFESWSWYSFAQPLSTLATIVTPYGVDWRCPPEYRIWK